MLNVPIWVYILFFVLLYIGIKRCFTRVVSVERIFIIPMVFTFISIRSTVSLFNFSLSSILILLFSSFAGSLLGYLHIRKSNIRADKEKHLIEIPGNISMLVMVMSIFMIEFFIHYAFEANWPIAQLSFAKYFAVCLSGLVVGVSIGRNITYFFKYKSAKSIDLVLT